MTELEPGNFGFYWSTLFFRELWQRGLTHVIISPGSRSTPLTMAAAAFPQFSKHVILDERPAAFTALGIGKATNQPAALICTSGTAVANYFPAVIEARKSGVPLLLLTADRPPHLHGTSANQTINQHQIFGDYPVFFHDVGEPVAQKTEMQNLCDTAAEAQRLARSRHGPAHINFPFGKPLEPKADFVKLVGKQNQELSDELPNSYTQDSNNNYPDEVLHDIYTAKQPLIIIGSLAASSSIDYIFKLAKWLGAPMLSEQGLINPSLSIQGFEGFLRNEHNREQLNPDLILRFGRQPASKSLLQAIKSWTPEHHIHVSDTGEISDIEGTTTDFVNWKGKHFKANKAPEKSQLWLRNWKEAEHTYFQKSEQLLSNANTLTDGHIYHHIAPIIPEDWSIFISNSFPARDHSMFGTWRSHRTYTNRGASGIDGITSTAIGVTIGSNQPVILFTGDLAFLHDTNALLNHDKLEQPLVVVVINNGGGSIFRMLPIVDHEEYFNTYFETPQEANITALAQTYGIHSKTIETVAELTKMDFVNLISDSEINLQIIECRTDPEVSMQLRKKLWKQKI